MTGLEATAALLIALGALVALWFGGLAMIALGAIIGPIGLLIHNLLLRELTDSYVGYQGWVVSMLEENRPGCRGNVTVQSDHQSVAQPTTPVLPPPSNPGTVQPNYYGGCWYQLVWDPQIQQYQWQRLS